jgi:hypothetical protein
VAACVLPRVDSALACGEVSLQGLTRLFQRNMAAQRGGMLGSAGAQCGRSVSVAQRIIFCEGEREREGEGGLCGPA